MNKNNIQIILDDEKIKSVLKIKDVINVVEEGFRKKGLGLINLPPKMGPKLNVEGAFAEAMPVSIFAGGGAHPRLQIWRLASLQRMHLLRLTSDPFLAED